MRNGSTKPATPAKAPTVRCAIYTRKSSEEGLQQEFNSLDAQREAAEAFITSQKAEGWVCLSDRYDDGGYTGGNMERPALKCLVSDMEAGKIDCVVVYKVDRLSRSLLDFARMMETFDRHKISFVSVTQHFNTSNSMGRLTLNILLSFAQFEREIIGERIRDKKAANCRKGKWPGGRPVLGYDVDRSIAGNPKLAVNPAEAVRVRQIFELYLEHGSLIPLANEIQRRKWLTKEWTNRAGRRVGGRPHDKCSLWALLTNPIYIGKIKHNNDYYPGEHEAIVPEDLFKAVQNLLQQNAQVAARSQVKNRYGALLRRLLYCKACGRMMVHACSSRGNRTYRYYTCTNAMKRGWSNCPSKSLPALEIEQAVVDQIRCIATDRQLLRETLRQSRAHTETVIERLMGEKLILDRGLGRLYAEMRRMTATEPTSQIVTARIADLNEQIQLSEARRVENEAQLAKARSELVSDRDAAAMFKEFDSIWRTLSVREQVNLLHLLISKVEFDAEEGAIEVSFFPSAIKALAEGSLQEAVA